MTFTAAQRRVLDTDESALKRALTTFAHALKGAIKLILKLRISVFKVLR